MQIAKPPHNRYGLPCLDNSIYVQSVNVYAGYKRCGVRGIYAFLGSTGLIGVVKEVGQSTVVQYGSIAIGQNLVDSTMPDGAAPIKLTLFITKPNKHIYMYCLKLGFQK